LLYGFSPLDPLCGLFWKLIKLSYFIILSYLIGNTFTFTHHWYQTIKSNKQTSANSGCREVFDEIVSVQIWGILVRVITVVSEHLDDNLRVDSQALEGIYSHFKVHIRLISLDQQVGRLHAKYLTIFLVSHKHILDL
jgi:hypothetical protein